MIIDAYAIAAGRGRVACIVAGACVLTALSPYPKVGRGGIVGDYKKNIDNLEKSLIFQILKINFYIY